MQDKYRGNVTTSPHLIIRRYFHINI